GGQRLAAPRGGDEEGMLAGRDPCPSLGLDRGRRAEGLPKPRLRGRAEGARRIAHRDTLTTPRPAGKRPGALLVGLVRDTTATIEERAPAAPLRRNRARLRLARRRPSLRARSPRRPSRPRR